MKKLLVIFVSAILVMSLCTAFASAEGENLVLSDVEWYQENGNGALCTITFEGGKAVVGGSTANTWPNVYATYAPEQCIIANIDEYSLHYDFEFTTGNTNITFIFSKDAVTPDNSGNYPISNSALGVTSFDAGSGDLYADHYEGYIKLSDLVNSTQNYDSTPFDKSLINANNELIFSGMKIYSVNGAEITINALELVPNDEVSDNSQTSSDAESTATSDEPTESTTSTEVSETTSDATSSVDTGSTTSNNTSGDVSAPAADEGGFPYLIIAVVAAVMVVAVVCVVFVGKKKK